jgi:fatty-acid peroxygenase
MFVAHGLHRVYSRIGPLRARANQRSAHLTTEDTMQDIPRDAAFDSTLAMLRDGYDFIWRRCRRLNSDLFRTRVLGKPTVCMHGREAAELFYDESKFQRKRAVPRRVVSSLFGKKAIHTLDDARHRARKAAFLGLMSRDRLEALMSQMAMQWRLGIRSWERAERVVLFDEVARILTRGVCGWAEIPLAEEDVAARARDLTAMVDSFGGVGPRLWQGKLARVRAERWIGGLIRDVRRGDLQVSKQSALYVMAHHVDANGKELSLRTAAVELLNVLRPTVAITWYVTFSALALHEHPEARAKLANEAFGHDAGEAVDLFMQEVRRYFPFTPYLGAKVRTSFAWRGHRFKPGTLVLLDVHGTNHDPRYWDAPDQFRPERFRSWVENPYTFIPQGGGHHESGHRCPGEWITMHNLALALHFLTRCMTYDVLPEQDLSYDLRRMPTRPRSGFVIHHVRATEALMQETPSLPSRAAALPEPAAPASPRLEITA